MKERVKIIIRGAVQGVGFRPFVFRIAKELKLTGYVINSAKGVFIEAEGETDILKNFIIKIQKEKPLHSIITSFEFSFLDLVGYTDFTIQKSEKEEEVSALVLPDIAVCDDCLSEMFDPNDRRYLYPFINCTNCGPRFTIIESLPYDRPNTSMKIFKMCPECENEYKDPLNRRFHAQPIACPDCGPHVELWDDSGKIIYTNHEAILQSNELIKSGKIIAVKGIGGFHLVVDSTNDEAVQLLRKKKHREEKPFALMFPDLDSVKKFCIVSDLEERLLKSSESPIVLLRKKNFKLNSQYLTSSDIHEFTISDLIAPDNPYLGVMLPYSPLHHLLMKLLNKPIVATSGNLSEEPICIDEYEALERLKGIADYFLVHNRPIVRHCDDSIVRIIYGREFIIRRARGYAPLPFIIDDDGEENIISVGGHLKNTISFKKKNLVFISQHIGDLSTSESFNAFKKTIESFKSLYEIDSYKLIGDLHPDYLSTKYLKGVKKDFHLVQHHLAHIAGCKSENQVKGECLGVSWDGTGFGLDGKIWGSEFFYINDSEFEHLGQFKKFPLPGGEIAIKEPRRTLAGMLYEIYNDDIFTLDLLRKKFPEKELKLIVNMIKQKINSPDCVSAGRLFDAVSSLLGICDYSNFEGQAAMKLEFAANLSIDESYDFNFNEEEIITIDWTKILASIINDIQTGISINQIAAKFHNTLTEIIIKFSQFVGLKKILLSGGCFQNVYLLERTIKRLKEENFQVYWHQRIPTNDGGISFCQIAAYKLKNRKKDSM